MTHLYPTSFMFPGVWTTSPNTSRFVNEFSSVWITYFHFGQSFIFRHSFTVCGSWYSSPLMMSIATWNANILSMIMSLRSFVSPVWLIEISSILDTGIWSTCAYSGVNCLLSWVSLFDPFIFVNSPGVLKFSYAVPFLFVGIKSFEPIGLPRYNIFHYNFWLYKFHKVVQNC